MSARPPTPAPWANKSPTFYSPLNMSPPPRLPSPLGAADTQFWWPNQVLWVNLIFKNSKAMDDFVKSYKGTLEGKVTISQPHMMKHSDRCFLRLSYFNSESTKNPERLPGLFYELWDAFEEKQLSVCTDESSPTGAWAFCSIMDKEHFKDCDFCRQFVKERMTQ